MGLKRVMGQFEVTFPAEDDRSLDLLASLVGPAFQNGGINPEAGTLARIAIVSVAVDPDPEPTIEGLETTEPADPTAPGGPLEWA